MGATEILVLAWFQIDRMCLQRLTMIQVRVRIQTKADLFLLFGMFWPNLFEDCLIKTNKTVCVVFQITIIQNFTSFYFGITIMLYVPSFFFGKECSLFRLLEGKKLSLGLFYSRNLFECFEIKKSVF